MAYVGSTFVNSCTCTCKCPNVHIIICMCTFTCIICICIISCAKPGIHHTKLCFQNTIMRKLFQKQTSKRSSEAYVVYVLAYVSKCTFAEQEVVWPFD